MRSISSAVSPAVSSACRAAVTDSEVVLSSGPTMRRSLMPVRLVIQSSEVSTIRSRSALVSTRSGTAMPQPVIAALRMVVPRVTGLRGRDSITGAPMHVRALREGCRSVTRNGRVVQSALLANRGPQTVKGRHCRLPSLPWHVQAHVQSPRSLTDPGLFGTAPPLLDDDHLTATVVPTCRADMMHHVLLAAGIARHQHRHVLEEIMTPPVALPMAGDALLWKCSHYRSPTLTFWLWPLTRATLIAAPSRSLGRREASSPVPPGVHRQIHRRHQLHRRPRADPALGSPRHNLDAS